MSSAESLDVSASLAPRKSFRDKARDFVPRGAGVFLFFLFFAALLVTRRFDCIQNPQFWAEEGATFFVQARENPFWINLIAYFYGYFDVLLRISHQIAALVPLDLAPLVLVLCAIATQAAVPAFVISSRCQDWMGPFPVRFVAAILYCAMPNSFEAHCIALHSRVHLAVLAALVLVSAPPRSIFGKIFDVATLILSGLSGPFVLLLAPVAIWRYWRERSPATRRNYLILAVTSICAIFALVSSFASRLGHPLGAGFFEAIRIIGGQFAMGFFLGQATFKNIVTQSYFDVAAILSFLALSILAFLMMRREKWQVRCLLLIGFGTLALALAAPIGGAPGMTQWHSLWSIPGNGQRYFFLPMAMMLFALAAVAGRGHGPVWRASALALLLLLATMGARVDWVLPAFTDFNFHHYVDLYQSSPPGASVTVPINPPGWKIELKKPASDSH